MSEDKEQYITWDPIGSAIELSRVGQAASADFTMACRPTVNMLPQIEALRAQGVRMSDITRAGLGVLLGLPEYSGVMVAILTPLVDDIVTARVARAIQSLTIPDGSA
jgi:hypothetical protein